MEINIKKLTLHQIDTRKNLVEKVKIDFKKETIVTYVGNLINEILESPNKRKYLFKDGETEVKSSISHIVENSGVLEDVLENNAKRLLEKELIADAAIRRMGKNVLRGSLLHIHFTQGENDRVLICKVDHDEIINEKSFELNRGLNTKKKVFKAFLIYLKSVLTDQEIYLNDKNNSKYWWSDFLELEQVKTDEENTEKALDRIVGIIDREKAKNEFALDGTILRNSVIGHFKNNKDFNFTNLFEDIFEEYEPYNTNFPIEKVKSKMNNLIDDTSFDKQFTIVQNKVSKKIKHKIKIGTGLYLNIEDFVVNLPDIIKPYKDVNGDVGMTILSDQAYNFVRKMNDEN